MTCRVFNSSKAKNITRTNIEHFPKELVNVNELTMFDRSLLLHTYIQQYIHLKVRNSTIPCRCSIVRQQLGI